MQAETHRRTPIALLGTRRIVLFGGTGFIGTHLAQFLLRDPQTDHIVLVDLNPPRSAAYTAELQQGIATGRVTFVQHDVRQPVPATLLPSTADLVCNFAAIHREPGHLSREYFETNLLGAENVCAWATAAGCRQIVFTSSISPYGPTEDRKTEASLPVPETAYGASKLTAEKMHLAWQAAAADRLLLILRPGVVFGPGEGGNVTRLIASLRKGYFAYTGNRATIKAATYVKELCLITLFSLRLLQEGKYATLTINVTLDPPPTMQQMVKAICKVLGRESRPASIPRWLMLGLAHPIAAIAKMLGVRQPIDPVRVRKLFRSNHVVPARLKELGYAYIYTLESAFQDWCEDSPQDFGKQPAA